MNKNQETFVRPARRAFAPLLALAAAALWPGCMGAPEDTPPGDISGELYSIGSIVQNPEGRTLFVQTIGSLDGELDNRNALEFAGNARHWAYGGAVYIGLAEEPTIAKYVPDDSGELVAAERINFLSYGLASIPAGNVFINENKAYLFAEDAYQIIIWNPSTMTIEGTIDLSELAMDGFDIELWKVSRKDNRVYAPLRYVNFDDGRILHQVSLVEVDTDLDEVVAVAHDDRCVGAAQPAITGDGTVYVLADGRSYLAQVYAQQREETPPTTCILRMLPGQTSFDPEFQVDIPSLTGGRDAVTSLWHVQDGIGFAKMFYPEELEPGTDTTNFAFWFNPVFKLWRIELGDDVVAEEVQGAPFSMVAFGGVSIDGSLFLGETQDAETSTVYEVPADSIRAEARIHLQGVMRGLYRLR